MAKIPVTSRVGQRRRNERRGAIVPLTAVMLVALIGLVAFAVDTNWMVMTKAQLQNSADVAALAGAQKLSDNYPLWAAPGQSTDNKATLAAAAATSAKSTAKTYGELNGAGGKTTLTYLDADIEIGVTAADGTYTAYSSNANGSQYPNTVKVRSRRDEYANTKLNMFFGQVLGMSQIGMSTTATATIYTATINSFNPPTSGNVMALPFCYDVNHWKNYIDTGKDPDNHKSYDNGAQGNPQLQVYPSTKYTGNFGQLSLDDSNVGSSTMRAWLTNGLTTSELSNLTSAGLLPLSSHDPNTWDWQGSTGFESSLIQEANDNIDRIGWLPLFKPVNSNENSYQPGIGTGANYQYNIVAFVPVRIVRSQNQNRQVTVQSVDMIDSSASFSSDSVMPAGTATGTNSYFASLIAPRLTN